MEGKILAVEVVNLPFDCVMGKMAVQQFEIAAVKDVGFWLMEKVLSSDRVLLKWEKIGVFEEVHWARSQV